MSTTSPGCPGRSPVRSPRGGRRSREFRASATGRLAGRGMPRLISSMIRCGSSLRGLSDVITTTSLSRSATMPISGRLVRSRSPPQPKTVIKPLRRKRSRGLEEISQRVVGMRIVDDDRHLVVGRGDDLEATGHAGQCRTPSAIASSGRPSDHRRRRRRKDVVDVWPADQLRLHRTVPRGVRISNASPSSVISSGPGTTSAARKSQKSLACHTHRPATGPRGSSMLMTPGASAATTRRDAASPGSTSPCLRENRGDRASGW